VGDWECPKGAWWVNSPPIASHRALSCLGTQQFAITVNACPITVDEGHGVAADRTVRRRSFIESRQDRKLNIVFVHLYPVRVYDHTDRRRLRLCFAPAFRDGQFEQHFILRFSRAHFQLQGLFGTFPAGHADERQPPVDDRRRHGTHRMPIGKFLTVWGRNIHFAV
jgi:hypothetical protein